MINRNDEWSITISPSSREGSKGCAFGIHYLHGSCNNIKGRYTPFTRFWYFLFSGKKKVPQRKAAGDIPRPLKLFYSHSIFAEVLSALL